MIARIGVTILAIALVLDMLVGNVLRAPIYWLTAWDWAKPSGRQSISAVVGHLAARNYRVGLFLQSAIDDFFGHGHCAAAAVLDDEIIRDEVNLGRIG